MAYSPLRTASRKEWLERVKVETAKQSKTFRCAACGHGPLPKANSPRGKASLCMACWYERDEILKCDCPRIRGDLKSVYACSLCPEYIGDDAKWSRNAVLTLDNLDTKNDQENYEQYHQRNGHSVRPRINHSLQPLRQAVNLDTPKAGQAARRPSRRPVG